MGIRYIFCFAKRRIKMDFREGSKWLEKVKKIIEEIFSDGNNDNPSGQASNSNSTIIINNYGNITIGDTHTVAYKLLDDRSHIEDFDKTIIDKALKIDADSNANHVPLWLFYKAGKNGEYGCMGVYISCSYGGKTVRFWLGGRCLGNEEAMTIELTGKEYNKCPLDTEDLSALHVQQESTPNVYWIEAGEQTKSDVLEILEKYLRAAFHIG
jgi:hypothetical protein